MAAIKIVESRAVAANARGPWLALPLAALGIAGLLRDSWPGVQLAPALNLHAIFGALLWLMTVVQYGHGSLAGAPLRVPGVRELRRRLSRRVYLQLYILFGVSLIVRMAAILWNNGSHGALHPAILPSPENFRDYLAYGVFALFTLHALAAVQCRGLRPAAT